MFRSLLTENETLSTTSPVFVDHDTKKIDDMKQADRERLMREKINLACDPGNSTSDEEGENCVSRDCNFNEHIYVISVDGTPTRYFDYKCRALKYMRECAREMCMNTTTDIFTYSVARHHNENSIDVVRRLSNVLIRYDQVVRKFRLHQIFKKKQIVSNK